MSRADQRKLLAKIVGLVEKIVQLITTSSTDKKEFKRLINQLSIFINALPWTDYGIKDFNRDIAWDEFIHLDEIVNSIQDLNLTEKIANSSDFFELLHRLKLILVKETAIADLENLFLKNEADLTQEQKLIKSLYINVDINSFESRHKIKSGLKELRTIAETKKDKEVFARIQSVLIILSSLDMSHIEHRYALLGVICEIGEALKNLSTSARKISDVSYFRVLSTLRDELRHCADSPSKTTALQNIIATDPKLFQAIQTEIKQQLTPAIDKIIANYQYDNTEPKIITGAEKISYMTISDVINPIKQIINELNLINHRALALLRDFLNNIFLIPVTREAQLRFSENLLKIVAVIRREAGLYIKQLKANKTPEDCLAIEDYVAELVKMVKAKISSEAAKIPDQDPSIATDYALNKLITTLNTIQSPIRSQDRIELRLKQAIDTLKIIAAQLEAAGVNIADSYVVAHAKIQKQPALNYAIRFQLLFLSSLLRSIYKKIPALTSLENHLDLMISIGNGVAHLQESNREKPPIEGAIYGVKTVLPELEKILAQHGEAKKNASQLSKVGLFATEDKENILVSNVSVVNPMISALQSRVLT